MLEILRPILGASRESIAAYPDVMVKPLLDGWPVATPENSVDCGETLPKFQLVHYGAKAIQAELGIDAPAQLDVVDEQRIGERGRVAARGHGIP